jgi:hypothetical protein
MAVVASPDRRPDHPEQPLPPSEPEELKGLIARARERAPKRRRRHGALLAAGMLAAAGLVVFGGHAASHHRATPRQQAAAGSAFARTCRTSQLKITTIHSGAGLGTSGAYIAFANESGAACQLTGWPRVVAVTAAGHPSPARDYPAPSFTVTTTGIGVPAVRLSPGERADAAFSAADNPGPGETRCPPSYRWLRVTRLTTPKPSRSAHGCAISMHTSPLAAVSP